MTTPSTIPVETQLWYQPIPELAKPIQVISDNEAMLIQGAVKKAQALTTLDTPEDFKEASQLLNELGRCRTYVKKQALDKGRPFRDESDRIKAMGDAHLQPILPMEKKVSDLMMDYRKAEDEKRQRLIEEARRLEEEARQRQEKAAQAVETAEDEAGFDEAAKAFGDGLAAAELAKETKDLIMPDIKARGAKEKKTISILNHVPDLVPRAFLVLDESKVKKAIAAGLVTQADKWITYKEETSFTGTGR